MEVSAMDTPPVTKDEPNGNTNSPDILPSMGRPQSTSSGEIPDQQMDVGQSDISENMKKEKMVEGPATIPRRGKQKAKETNTRRVTSQLYGSKHKATRKTTRRERFLRRDHPQLGSPGEIPDQRMSLKQSESSETMKNGKTFDDPTNASHKGKEKAKETIRQTLTRTEIGHRQGTFRGETSHQEGSSSPNPESEISHSQPPPSVVEKPNSSDIEMGYSHDKFIPLYQAALKGDWKAAKSILQSIEPAKVEVRQTVLYIAVLAKHAGFIQKMIEDEDLSIPGTDLELEAISGHTPLSVAVSSGTVHAGVTRKRTENKGTSVPGTDSESKAVSGDTAPSVAASSRSVHTGVTENVTQDKDHSPPGTDMEPKVVSGDTALSITASSGTVKMAEIMVKKHEALLTIRSKDGFLPITIATLLGRSEMASYLFHRTPFRRLTELDRFDLLTKMIARDMYDLALEILEKDRTLATVRDFEGKLALSYLAQKPTSSAKQDDVTALHQMTGALLGSSSMPIFLQTFLRDWWPKRTFKKIPIDAKARRLLERLLKEIPMLSSGDSSLILAAVESGNVEFLTILIRSRPDLVLNLENLSRAMFQTSLLKRQEGIFNLLSDMGALTYVIAFPIGKGQNNILHIAAKLPLPGAVNIVKGAAFQMQEELWWFKKIEEIVPPSFSQMENSDGLTPKDLFSKTHKRLRRDAENWMKNTAQSSMLVATLIATVVFAAVFTIPDGSNHKSSWFLVFFISNALALFFSSSSIFAFLSILVARYTDEDFLELLPNRLVGGIIALLVSIVGMLFAFSATCFMVYQTETVRIPTPMIALAIVPVFFFAGLHYNLLLDAVRSTYRSTFSSGKRQLFREI